MGDCSSLTHSSCAMVLPKIKPYKAAVKLQKPTCSWHQWKLWVQIRCRRTRNAWESELFPQRKEHCVTVLLFSKMTQHIWIRYHIFVSVQAKDWHLQKHLIWASWPCDCEPWRDVTGLQNVNSAKAFRVDPDMPKMVLQLYTVISKHDSIKQLGVFLTCFHSSDYWVIIRCFRMLSGSISVYTFAFHCRLLCAAMDLVSTFSQCEPMIACSPNF